MDRVAISPTVVQDAIERYLGPLYKGTLHSIPDLDRKHFALLAIPDASRTFKPSIVLFARIVDDSIVIDVDTTDQPLVDTLVDAGIPRSQIVLGYAGEVSAA